MPPPWVSCHLPQEVFHQARLWWPVKDRQSIEAGLAKNDETVCELTLAAESSQTIAGAPSLARQPAPGAPGSVVCSFLFFFCSPPKTSESENTPRKEGKEPFRWRLATAVGMDPPTANHSQSGDNSVDCSHASVSAAFWTSCIDFLFLAPVIKWQTTKYQIPAMLSENLRLHLIAF